MAELAKPKRASFPDKFYSSQGTLTSVLNRYDATAIAIYAAIAALALLGRWRGGVVEVLMGDAAAHSSAVAGRLEPYRFIGGRASVMRFSRAAPRQVLQRHAAVARPGSDRHQNGPLPGRVVAGRVPPPRK